jgi:catechol 2,3-dioxygenase-like lactoylglutathione lyase family enzyme
MAVPFLAFDHVQLAMPPGREDDARAFYVSVCGMTELPKPAELAQRGGAWFASGELQLHLGIEPGFQPSAKAHLAIRCADLDGLLVRLGTAGCDVREDANLPGLRRAFVNDPFGNRIELIAARNGNLAVAKLQHGGGTLGG